MYTSIHVRARKASGLFQITPYVKHTLCPIRYYASLACKTFKIVNFAPIERHIFQNVRLLGSAILDFKNFQTVRKSPKLIRKSRKYKRMQL